MEAGFDARTLPLFADVLAGLVLAGLVLADDFAVAPVVGFLAVPLGAGLALVARAFEVATVEPPDLADARLAPALLATASGVLPALGFAFCGVLIVLANAASHGCAVSNPRLFACQILETGFDLAGAAFGTGRGKSGSPNYMVSMATILDHASLALAAWPRVFFGSPTIVA